MERKNSEQIKKLCMTAMLTALVCVSTIAVRIPSPLGGYINLGDTFVIISGWLLGPVYGFIAGGMGSAFADLFSGYTAYVPGTLIIKGIMALICSFLSAGRAKKLISSVIAEAVMIIGYYFYAVILGYGLNGALQTIPGNAVQGVLGIIGSIVIGEIVVRIGNKRI